MNPAMPTVIDRLSELAQHMQQLCIRKTGAIYVPAVTADASPFHAPPLTTTLSLAGVEFDDMIADLYRQPQLDVDTIIGNWGACCKLIGNPGSSSMIAQGLREMYPNVPFSTPQGFDIRARMVQFLKVASFTHGSFNITRTSARLNISGARLGIDGNWLEWRGGSRRLRQGLPTSFMHLVKVPLGSARLSTPDSGAVHRHLCTEFPSLIPWIEAMFQVAVKAGRSAEHAITSQFDVEFDRENEAKGLEALNAALVLVATSHYRPHKELADLLVPLMGRKTFVRVFGNDPGRDVIYTQPVRNEHRAAILGMKNAHLSGQVRNETAATLELLAIENRLKGQA